MNYFDHFMNNYHNLVEKKNKFWSVRNDFSRFDTLRVSLIFRLYNKSNTYDAKYLGCIFERQNPMNHGYSDPSHL